jgi:hypothetical protein
VLSYFDRLRHQSMTNQARNTELKNAARQSARDVKRHGKPRNPKRRSSCKRDLLKFLRTYLVARFPLPFSEDHLRVIALLQGAILNGGLQAVAMPRGSGKTTLCEGALIWALVYGHRRFILAVACDAPKALAIVGSLKAELEHNDLIAEDFPEVCDYVHALKGIARRAEGQTSDGEQTLLLWTKDEVRLPRYAAGGGSVIRAAGITGAIRGAKAVLADGTQVRPDLVLVDDPQTDESAKSPSQITSRLSTMTGTILGLAGPGESIACLTTLTVIQRGDLADQILDRQAHPEWQGVKSSLMRKLPSNQALWDEYGEILREDLRAEQGMARATTFYFDHRAEMDAGADPSWPERKKPDELSAVQHAMNLQIIFGPDAFAAEYQNDPVDPLASSDVEQLSPPVILKKLNREEREDVPQENSLLTVGIDVQQKALYWMASAWTMGFSGDVVSYGAYPDQGRPYFTLTEIEKTMEKAHPGASWEAALYASLEHLVNSLCGREWKRTDGSVARVDQVVIDAGYGNSTDTVYKFCRQSQHAALLMPYFGRATAAGATPMGEWKKKSGDRTGPGWRIARPVARQTRHILADANIWKSFVADRLLAPFGSGGCLSIYGKHPSEHRMLADQLSAENRTRVTANGRTSDEWRVKPNRDNHFIDTLSMSAIGASMRGAKLDAEVVVRAERARHVEMTTSNVAPVTEPPKPLPPQPAAPIRTPRRGGGWLSGYGSKL